MSESGTGSGGPSASGGGPFVISGPAAGHGAAAERILRVLPGWFGIESSILDYARAAEELPTFVAEAGDEGIIGFVTLKATSEAALEIHVMAVLPEWHRRGLGRALLERSAEHARVQGFTLLHVKTLAPSDPDPNYARTRAFYTAMGFRPLEVLPQVWGPDNPCLLMVMTL